MKRIASLVNTLALAAALVGAETAAQSQSAMYLKRISTQSTYTAGQNVTFAVMLDLGTSNFVSFSVPTAVAYLSSQFGPTRPTATAYTINADPDSIFDQAAPTSYTTTAFTIGGAKLYAVQATPGHTPNTPDGFPRGAVPAGTYTLATFTLPVASIPGGFGAVSATVYLPTAYGYSNKASNTDGAFIGTAPTLSITGKDASGNGLSDPLMFPNTASKPNSLTFNVLSPVAVYGSVGLGLASNAPNQPITFVFTAQSNGAISTFTLPIGPAGGFSAYPLNPLETYDVTIQGSKWLKRRLTITTTYDYGLLNTALIGGDANGDNSVDASDFGILVGAYNSESGVPGSGYDAAADFNCDGSVDASDFGILVGSYNQTGDN